jgi:hypothetical protein
MIRPDLKPCPFRGLPLKIVGVGAALHPESDCILSASMVHAVRFAAWNRRAQVVEGGAV